MGRDNVKHFGYYAPKNMFSMTDLENILVLSNVQRIGIELSSFKFCHLQKTIPIAPQFRACGVQLATFLFPFHYCLLERFVQPVTQLFAPQSVRDRTCSNHNVTTNLGNYNHRNHKDRKRKTHRYTWKTSTRGKTTRVKPVHNTSLLASSRVQNEML